MYHSAFAHHRIQSKLITLAFSGITKGFLRGLPKFSSSYDVSGRLLLEILSSLIFLRSGEGC
jgi:hypothetical protein